MSPESSSDLKDYILACKQLSQDLTHAINDLDCTSEQNYQISYAVDFSELFEYILPSNAYRDFATFFEVYGDNEDKENKGDEKTIAAKAIQQVILRYILFNLTPQKITLLHPYLLEFKSFINKYSSHLFVESIRNANLLYKRFEEITSKNIEDILEICKKANQNTLSKKEVQILAHFIEKFGQFQSIIENIESQSSPWQRIKLLDPQYTFKTPDISLLHFEGKINSDVYERWLQKLSRLRQPESEASNKIDAAAIQYLFDINRAWPKNHRLILISRSKHMHDIYNQEIEEGCWEKTGDYYLLRHPRVFSLIMPALLPGNPYNRNYLENLRNLISNLLLQCESCQENDQYSDEGLNKDIREIIEKWQNIQKFAITLGSTVHERPDVKQNLAERAQTIMDGIRKLVKKGVLIDHLITMVKTLDEIYDSIQVPSQEFPEDLKALIDEADNKKLAAPFNKLFMHYTLYLESSELNDRIDNLFSKADLNPLENLKSLHQSADNESSEINLAMAYMLGALGMWPVAEKFCRDALAKEYPTENLRNEGKYFLAVCIIQQQTSLLHLMEAYQLLNELPKKTELWHHSRYQIEYGTLILIIHCKYTKNKLDIPPVADGLFILNTEQNEIQNNISLWLTVLKVKFDYFYSQKDNKNILNLKREWGECENELLKLEPNSDNWPPNIVDAVAWGKWLLFADEFKMEDKRQVLLDMLKKALNKAPTELAVHNDIKFHIKEIPKTAVIDSSA